MTDFVPTDGTIDILDSNSFQQQEWLGPPVPTIHGSHG